MTDMTPNEIEALLANSRIGRLCMADASGKPYSIPLPFCWADGSIYLRLPLTGRKGQVLSQNDRVCFEIDTFTDSLDSYASVLVEGRLIAVTDLDEKARIRAINTEKYNLLRNGHRPGHKGPTPLSETPLRKIHVTQLSGRRNNPKPIAIGA